MMRWTLVLSFSLAACGDDGGLGPADAGPDLAADEGPACVAARTDLVPNDESCPNPEPAAPDRLDEALSGAGLDRCSAVYTASEWNYWGGNLEDSFRLPHFGIVHDAPLRAPAWAHETATALDAEEHPIARAIHLAAHRLGRGGAEFCLEPEPSPSLAQALASLRTSFGDPSDAADLADGLADVPVDLQGALAPIVVAIEAAALIRDEAIASYAGLPIELYDTIYSLILPKQGVGVSLDSTTMDFLANGFDAAALYEAAARLALTIEDADLGRFAGAMGFGVDLPTPLGRVVIRDAGDDTYEPAMLDEAYALIVDTGGNDVYRVSVGATTSVDSRVAVAIDLAGNDEYAYVENPDSSLDGTRLPSDDWGRLLCHPSVAGAGCSMSATERQGAGRMGIGLLLDLGDGDDEYRSLRLSQGFGALGVGVLFDDGGDDTYAIEAGGQGSALFGIGLLLDQGGADRYAAYEDAQGFGFVFGFGALRDGGTGDDVYYCDSGDPSVGGDPLYQSAQLPCDAPDDSNCGNNSFCQGAGFGRRDDPACATCMSGGIGVLRDNGGDDVYTAGVFAQGTGYWFGTGILDDEAGNDRYDGLWYVQGSTAHFALAVFREGGGDDKYDEGFPIRATSIGVGHDYSTSVHLDLGGNDLYDAPGLSLGAGNDNGHGYLINVGGNDTYIVPGEDRTLGGTSPPTARPAKTIGIFVDVGGSDTYTVPGMPTLTRGDNLTWIWDGDDGDAVHACGLDQATGELTLP